MLNYTDKNTTKREEISKKYRKLLPSGKKLIDTYITVQIGSTTRIDLP